MTTHTQFTAIILSGGAGTRLWPLSRQHYPKQFISLFGDKSLLTLCLERIIPLQPERIVVVCNAAHRFMVMEHLRALGIKDSTIITEPEARNTAPAIALASIWLRQHCRDIPVLVLPSDHHIEGGDLGDYINDELVAATSDSFVTFGVQPTRAESGYGYIQAATSEPSSDSHSAQTSSRLLDVAAFIEKPSHENAEKYIKSGAYYWNSGIFFFKVEQYLQALRRYQSSLYEACNAALCAGETSSMDGYHLVNPNAKHFNQSPNISIDYAVMEHVKNIRMCPLNMRWSDLGSWQALAAIQGADEDGNTLSGKGSILTEDSKNNMIYADSKLVVCLGVDDQLIAETKDAVLIADRKRGQEIKQLVTKLRENGYTESDLHTKVYRPWGSYESIDKGPNFQVKRIIVNPGQQLSLQSHRHRAEHWVVVKGRAKVTVDERRLDLQVNQSVYIPIGAKHRLENKTSQPLHLIEVQCGDYLGEDDIQRYEDNYGRVND